MSALSASVDLFVFTLQIANLVHGLVGEMMSGTEFADTFVIGNSRWPPATKWKNYNFVIDHHGGHKVGPILFILGKKIAKL
jgi:hypothetical protein